MLPPITAHLPVLSVVIVCKNLTAKPTESHWFQRHLLRSEVFRVEPDGRVQWATQRGYSGQDQVKKLGPFP